MIHSVLVALFRFGALAANARLTLTPLITMDRAENVCTLRVISKASDRRAVTYFK